MKLREGTRKYIEQELRFYHESLKEVEKEKTVLMQHRTYSEDRGQGAILLLTHRRIQDLSMITQAIQSIYESIEPEKQKFIQLYYWTRPRELTIDGVAQRLNVGRTTLFRWKNEILYLIAERLGKK